MVLTFISSNDISQFKIFSQILYSLKHDSNNLVAQRVKDFLPKFAKANEELEARMKENPNVANIEVEDDNYLGPVIEMVALFVHFGSLWI